jgi:hypothetical protein
MPHIGQSGYGKIRFAADRFRGGVPALPHEPRVTLYKPPALA